MNVPLVGKLNIIFAQYMLCSYIYKETENKKRENIDERILIAVKLLEVT